MAVDVVIGDIVKLQNRYRSVGDIVLIVDINKSEWLAKNGGWVSFEYIVLNEKGQVLSVSSSCVEKIINSS